MGSILTRRDLDWELLRLDVFAEYCEHHQRAGTWLFEATSATTANLIAGFFRMAVLLILWEGADQTGVDQTEASRPVQDLRTNVAGEKSFVPGSRSFIPGSESFIPGSRSSGRS